MDNIVSSYRDFHSKVDDVCASFEALELLCESSQITALVRPGLLLLRQSLDLADSDLAKVGSVERGQ